MKCGHVANAKIDGKPCCAICYGIKDGATEIDTLLIDESIHKGREAKCPYCKTIVNSSYKLPFFKYKKDEQYDEYYCGCYGFD